METMTGGKYKINITEIIGRAIAAAFSDDRSKVNEDGLSPEALEAKKSVIAEREAVRLFMAEALAQISAEEDKRCEETTGEAQRMVIEQARSRKRTVESIASGALASHDVPGYLSRFCEGGAV